MPSTVDLSTLAHVSEGYTAGSIYCSVKTTLTPRRVHRIAKRPLLSSEFLGVLAQQQQLLKKHVQASVFSECYHSLFGAVGTASNTRVFGVDGVSVEETMLVSSYRKLGQSVLPRRCESPSGVSRKLRDVRAAHENSS